jgi:predicted RNase H-like HicB family nuclease
MITYDVVYEETPTGFSAYVPRLPGVIAAGESRDEVHALIREGIAFHLEAAANTVPYGVVLAQPRYIASAIMRAEPGPAFFSPIVTGISVGGVTPIVAGEAAIV